MAVEGLCCLLNPSTVTELVLKSITTISIFFFFFFKKDKNISLEFYLIKGPRGG